MLIYIFKKYATQFKINIIHIINDYIVNIVNLFNILFKY